MYDDIVTTVGKGNRTFLVLLDLSAAFDTFDHDNLIYILEKYVGIVGSARRLIRSYFCDRTQRVQIDGVWFFEFVVWGATGRSYGTNEMLFVFASTWCDTYGHHNISCHIYADDTQLYISFKDKDPFGTIDKLNMCISDIRVWMIIFFNQLF